MSIDDWQSDSDEWQSDSDELNLDAPTIKGLPGCMGEQIYRLLHTSSPTKGEFMLLFLQLKTMIQSPSGPSFQWQYLDPKQIFLLSKQLAGLIERKIELETRIVRECYQIIITLSRHYKVKDKTKAVYTQWILQSNREELKALHIIFSYLVRYDPNYSLGSGAGGTGHLSSKK